MGNGLSKDIRNDSTIPIEYIIEIQWAGDSPILLTWGDGLDSIAGAFRLNDTVNGSIIDVDMKSVSQYELADTGISQLKISYWNGVWEKSYPAGWSMASVGIELDDTDVASVFPTNISVYNYDGGYNPLDSQAQLTPGEGYWINLPESYNETARGKSIEELELSLPERWSMIGSISNPLAVSAIIQNPPGNIISVFGFDDGYYQADTLIKGRGFWINLAETGTITLGGAGGGSPKPMTAESLVEELRNGNVELPLTFDTHSGEKQVIFYLGTASQKAQDYTRYCELPPIPPSGSFDVRVAEENTNGLWGAVVDDDKAFEKHIDVMLPEGAQDIEVTWNGTDLTSGRYTLSDGRKTVDMSVAESFTVNSGSTRLTFASGGAEGGTVMITEYRLDANYPNPFNPETTIPYTIKDKGYISLTIYNMVGQEIRRLVDDTQPTGNYTVMWDGTDARGLQVSGGVYLYRLKVNGYVETKKMLLVK